MCYISIHTKPCVERRDCFAVVADPNSSFLPRLVISFSLTCPRRGSKYLKVKLKGVWLLMLPLCIAYLLWWIRMSSQSPNVSRKASFSSKENRNDRLPRSQRGHFLMTSDPLVFVESSNSIMALKSGGEFCLIWSDWSFGWQWLSFQREL